MNLQVAYLLNPPDPPSIPTQPRLGGSPGVPVGGFGLEALRYNIGLYSDNGRENGSYYLGFII